MVDGDDSHELKFRLYDGTDIGHGMYSGSMAVETLKQRLLSIWPLDKTITPKSVNDVTLVHAGKVLENTMSLGDSKVGLGNLPGGVITMHVVIQPHVKKKKDKKEEKKGNINSCSCNIL